MKYVHFVVIGALILVSGFFLLSSPEEEQTAGNQENTQTSNQTTELNDNTPEEAETTEDLRYGKQSAPAEIIEFMDYKCPACVQFHLSTFEEIDEKFVQEQGTASINVKPMAVIFDDSRPAALGAYCAHEQGRFTQYHHAVISYMWDEHYSSGSLASEFQNVLTVERLQQINTDAKTGVDTQALGSCIEADTYAENLTSNQALASDNGVFGTPGFIVGGQAFAGGQPLSVFDTLIGLAARQG